MFSLYKINSITVAEWNIDAFSGTCELSDMHVVKKTLKMVIPLSILFTLTHVVLNDLYGEHSQIWYQ